MKNMITNFPDVPHTMGFVAFSRNVGNLWENPYISHMLKYTIGWELDGKKAPRLWEKYDYQFPRLPHTMGFVAFSCTVGNLWGNPCTSHMMASVKFFLWDLLKYAWFFLVTLFRARFFIPSLPYGSQFSPNWNLSLLLDLSLVPLCKVFSLMLDYRCSHNPPT